MKNIVVISQNRNFFGAQIVHIPLLRMLRVEYPQCKIYYFSKSAISKLLLALNVVDEVVVEESKWHFLQEYKQISADLTVNLRKKSLWHVLVAIIFNRKQKVGFNNGLSKLFFDKVVDSDSSIYRAKNYLALFDKQMCYDEVKKSNRICIVPGAGQDFKIWSLDNYIKLARKISNVHLNIEIVFVIGEKELPFAALLSEFTVLNNAPIDQVFDYIESSELLIANDCGPSHIGHINAVPVISIFSDEFAGANSAIREWFNQKGNSFTIQSKPMQSINSITVEEVFAKVEQCIG
jgi:ADP-heptose:LPS heptosyltransferase